MKPKREFKKIKKQNESAGNELINKLSNCEIQHCNIIKCFTKFSFIAKVYLIIENFVKHLIMLQCWISRFKCLLISSFSCWFILLFYFLNSLLGFKKYLFSTWLLNFSSFLSWFFFIFSGSRRGKDLGWRNWEGFRVEKVVDMGVYPMNQNNLRWENKDNYRYLLSIMCTLILINTYFMQSSEWFIMIFL